ncbi:MAG: hypothetical protein GY820_45330 [Gammaproteobacteria bacterium]|nr:hypothetical protein [Gammaproteobacteria bacterium]
MTMQGFRSLFGEVKPTTPVVRQSATYQPIVPLRPVSELDEARQIGKRLGKLVGGKRKSTRKKGKAVVKRRPKVKGGTKKRKGGRPKSQRHWKGFK